MISERKEILRSFWSCWRHFLDCEAGMDNREEPSDHYEVRRQRLELRKLRLLECVKQNTGKEGNTERKNSRNHHSGSPWMLFNTNLSYTEWDSTKSNKKLPGSCKLNNIQSSFRDDICSSSVQLNWRDFVEHSSH